MNGQYDLEIVRPMACADISQVVEIERQVKFHPWAQTHSLNVLKRGINVGLSIPMIRSSLTLFRHFSVKNPMC